MAAGLWGCEPEPASTPAETKPEPAATPEPEPEPPTKPAATAPPATTPKPANDPTTPDAKATAAPPPEDPRAPAPAVAPTATGPRWTLTCTPKGKPATLNGTFAPNSGVLALEFTDDAGRTRTWAKPEDLVLFSDLEHDVLGIFSKRPMDGFGPEFIALHAIPKTFRLEGTTATARATLSVANLDAPDDSLQFDVQCEALQKSAP